MLILLWINSGAWKAVSRLTSDGCECRKEATCSCRSVGIFLNWSSPVLQGFVTICYSITKLVALRDGTPVPSSRLQVTLPLLIRLMNFRWGLLIGYYRLCWGNPCDRALLPHFQHGEEPDGKTQVLPVHKELFLQALVAGNVYGKNKGQEKSP